MSPTQMRHNLPNTKLRLDVFFFLKMKWKDTGKGLYDTSTVSIMFYFFKAKEKKTRKETRKPLKIKIRGQ